MFASLTPPSDSPFSSTLPVVWVSPSPLSTSISAFPAALARACAAPCDNRLRSNGRRLSRVNMTTLQELLDKQAALNHQITALRVAQREQAIAEVQALLAQHRLTVADISASGSRARAASYKAS